MAVRTVRVARVTYEAQALRYSSSSDTVSKLNEPHAKETIGLRTPMSRDGTKSERSYIHVYTFEVW